MNLIMKLVGLLGGVALIPLAASANLIPNGDFEPDQSHPFSSHNPGNDPDEWVLGTSSPYSTAIDGWTVVGQPVAWLGPNNNLGLASSTQGGGGYFLNLAGLTSPFGGVSTTVNTVPGQKYHLSFDLGSDLKYDTATLGVIAPQLQVFNSATGKTSTFTEGIIGNDTWEGFDLSFTATSSQTTLAFNAATYKALPVGFIGLDNVNLVGLTAIPEPSGWIASVLLLVPLGAGTLRVLRKSPV